MDCRRLATKSSVCTRGGWGTDDGLEGAVRAGAGARTVCGRQGWVSFWTASRAASRYEELSGWGGRLGARMVCGRQVGLLGVIKDGLWTAGRNGKERVCKGRGEGVACDGSGWGSWL